MSSTLMTAPSSLQWINAWAEHDSDLDSNRDDPRFVAILENLRARHLESARATA